jgi:hypothetical protein
LKEPNMSSSVCSLDNWFKWIAGAKEGVAFLNEFTAVGFSHVKILKTSRNARTSNPNIIVADVVAVK